MLDEALEKAKQETKRRTDIKALVELSGVTLTKSGRAWKGLCPFHTENTGSFFVSPKSGTCHCFGCGWRGDAIDFYREKYGVEFFEALTYLANQCGVALPKYERSANIEARKEKAARLIEINEMALLFFKRALWAIDETGRPLEYLHSRGLTDNSIRMFQLGYALPGWTNLIDRLAQKGVKPEELVEAGLAGRTESGRYYDFFRNRLIFPVFNRLGQPIAFSGRELDKGDGPKYLNTPATFLFDKGSTLFGLYYTREAIRQTKKVVVVEGNLDMLLSYQAGITYVVAPLGTALTEKHVAELRRLADTIVLAFDGDSAGENATQKAIDIINLERGSGASLYVVETPVGADAADVINSPNLGAPYWKQLVFKALPVIDYFFELATANGETRTAAGRRAFFEKMAPVVRAQSGLEREVYITRLAQALGADREFVKEQLFQASAPKQAEAAGDEATPEDRLIAAVLNYLPFSLNVDSSDGETMKLSDFSNPANLMLAEALLANPPRTTLEAMGQLEELGEEIKPRLKLLNQLIAAEPQLNDEIAIAQSVRFRLDKVRKQALEVAYRQIVDYIEEVDDKGEQMQILTGAQALARLKGVYS